MSMANFISWLEVECHYFNLLQQLANGTKHAFPVGGSKVAG